jgi:hypothetical protein
MKTGTCRSAAIEELADVVICTLSFANRTGIDIAKAVKQKVEKNEKKYPVASIRGSIDLNDAPFQNLYFNHVIKETKDRPLAMSLPEGHKELIWDVGHLVRFMFLQAFEQLRSGLSFHAHFPPPDAALSCRE